MIRIFFLSALLFFCPIWGTPPVTRFSSADAAAEAAALKIAWLIEKKPKAVLGLATGSTMIPVYAALKKILREKNLDLSQVTAFNLDEYIGIPANHPQSYRSFMYEHLYQDLLQSQDRLTGLREENLFLPNGEGADPENQAAHYEALIEEKGPIDLQILGIGRNGHIGFSEPGTSFDSPTHVAQLTELTRKDNGRFFEKEAPERAITMGIGTILKAKEILLIATGDHKAEIVAKTLKDPISSDIPSTSLRRHSNVSFFVDAPAASLLESKEISRFYRARLVRGHEIEEGELWIQGNRIVPPQAYADREIDVGGKILAPGFVDLQINGGFGCDFSRNPEELEKVAHGLLRFGVTSFLPTIVSSSPDRYRAVIPLLQPRSFDDKAAEILGLHLEGPFFPLSCCGAHNKEFLLPDMNGNPEATYGGLEGVKIVTLAPELPGAIAMIEQLRKRNILVSAGHSAANAYQMKAGIDAGIGLATHLFNAMTPYHHRNPGIIGSALIHPSLPYSLIVDGIHLSPEAVLLCWRCNPEGLILISDATEALGLPDGDYKLGNLETQSRNGQIYLAGTETIAGSSLDLGSAVRKFHSITQCSIFDAIEAATAKPARLIGSYPKKGSLEFGADADFLILSDSLEVEATYVGGELAWQKEDRQP